MKSNVNDSSQEGLRVWLTVRVLTTVEPTDIMQYGSGRTVDFLFFRTTPTVPLIVMDRRGLELRTCRKRLLVLMP